MTITKNALNGTVELKLEGRLDTVTAPDLEKTLEECKDGMTQLTLDFAGLEYVSSAGLRVILSAQKLMNAKNGSMKIVNVNGSIMEVFEITGFSDILTIE